MSRFKEAKIMQQKTGLPWMICWLNVKQMPYGWSSQQITMPDLSTVQAIGKVKTAKITSIIMDRYALEEGGAMAMLTHARVSDVNSALEGDYMRLDSLAR